jgi:hypothetical protein
VVRPEGLELSTFWFVAEQGQNLSACSGVAYEQISPFLGLTLIPKNSDAGCGEAERLIRIGKMPTLDQLCAAVLEAWKK